MTSHGGPVSYEVTLDVDAALRDAVLRELIEHHIPAILATGCFRAIQLEQDEAGRIRTRYEAPTRADLDRYLAEHTGRFRAEFMARFPTGVRPSRAVWRELDFWCSDPLDGVRPFPQ
jgi:hypothetical protein